MWMTGPLLNFLCRLSVFLLSGSVPCKLQLSWVSRRSAPLFNSESLPDSTWISFLHAAWKLSRQNAGAATGLVSYWSRITSPLCPMYSVLTSVISFIVSGFWLGQGESQSGSMFLHLGGTLHIKALPEGTLCSSISHSASKPPPHRTSGASYCLPAHLHQTSSSGSRVTFTLENATGFSCPVLSKARPVASLPSTIPSTLWNGRTGISVTMTCPVDSHFLKLRSPVGYSLEYKLVKYY